MWPSRPRRCSRRSPWTRAPEPGWTRPSTVSRTCSSSCAEPQPPKYGSSTVTTDSSTDNTGWASLYTAASNGQLMLESGIAAKCAQYVENMLNSVVGVNNWIAKNYQQGSPVFASTPSGEELQAMFGFIFSAEVPHLMEQHAAVLTDMGNTFVAAGKQYANAENISAANFESISFDDPSGGEPSGAPEPQTIPTLFRGSSFSDTATQTTAITPEEGGNFTWPELYAIGQSIDPQAVADAAGVWYWLAGSLAANFSTLGSNITSVADQWTGEGATSAINATQNYVSASTVLTDGMNKYGHVLLYSSGWLQDTKN